MKRGRLWCLSEGSSSRFAPPVGVGPHTTTPYGGGPQEEASSAFLDSKASGTPSWLPVSLCFYVFRRFLRINQSCHQTNEHLRQNSSLVRPVTAVVSPVTKEINSHTMTFATGLHMRTTTGIILFKIQMNQWSKQQRFKLKQFRIWLTASDFVISVWAVGDVITAQRSVDAIAFLTRKSTFSAHFKNSYYLS